MIKILEFPTNLGLKKTDDFIEPGVKYLPDWLNKYGFHKRINPSVVKRIEPFEYSMDLDEESGVRNAEKMIEYAKKQTVLLLDELNDGSFVIILGGDCSVLIGSALALKKKGKFGLFFLDGHTDFITPELSNTHGAAGMDLAIVTGHGHPKLTNIEEQRSYFGESNVFCVGNREYDITYEKPILESSINYINLGSLRKIGIKKTVDTFLLMIEDKDLDGFFIHFDVDVLNDNIMPAVDSRAKDGLYYNELFNLLYPLLNNDKCVGIEITILDPDLDPEGKYTRDFVDNFVKLLRHP